MKTLAYDPERCEGARACEVTCAQTWFDVSDVQRSSIRIRSKNGGFAAEFCIQCGACVSVCPVNALVQAKNGVVHVRKHLCVGCMACVGFCPYGVMYFDTDGVTPFKCVACGQCVDACPTQALTILELPEDEEPTPDLWTGATRARFAEEDL